MSNSLDQDQERHPAVSNSLGPDLGVNCFQRLPADDKSWR